MGFDLILQFDRKSDKASPKGEKMFFKKQEKKRLNPWCVIIVGGLAVAGAVSLANMGKEFVREKGQAVMSFFKKKGSVSCECSPSDE